ncbi:MAG: ribosome silencing factor [Clostridia bacterium]|nr:ribosome silencing factor [Clostridia bacterium]
MTQTSEKSLAGASSREIADAIVKVLDEKNAGDIKLLRVDDKTVVTDYFVICTANSTTQVKSLAGEVEFRLGEMGIEPAHVEGYDGSTWVALDFLHVIVHIFHRDQREFYKLEKVWADAEDIPVKTTEK